jgi:hypothetical protein
MEISKRAARWNDCARNSGESVSTNAVTEIKPVRFRELAAQAG